MKKILFLLSLSLFLSSCSVMNNSATEQKVVKKNNKEQAIIPKYSGSGDHYKTILPLKEQKVINVINKKANSKLDMKEFESGLFNISLKQFDSKNHYFQRSSYLSEKIINELVVKQDVPYVSNIIEQDYFIKNGSDQLDLKGVVIGLAMTSDHSNEEVLAKGTGVANKLLKAFHENKEFKNVPVTFAVFKEESATSIKNGTFIAEVTVPTNESTVGKWNNINEKSFIYPSDEFKQVYGKDYEKLDKFSTKLKEFSSDYIPVNATVLYKDDKLDKLDMNVVFKFNGNAELIGFTQFTTQSILDILPKDINIQLRVKSDAKDEAIIIQEKNMDDPFVSFLK
ncbi:CamS family sex pheromone protein [Bacillus pseudomycoides]|uniref:CamS family sex pheromone protein n=1 Tax=Bacillus pseudomycoides TaxID=64104 RepID=UPI000BFA848E|nr:CamS family sex pheromone protein [Bacillus pseudomycoides]PGD90018.1 sex pheromone [Bacillus pseudomycoides]